MTPSNNPNGEPLIYRICDAAGVFHLVAPVDHHHSQDEIDGLAAALTAKANAADVQTALEGKQNALTFDTTPTAGSTNPVTSGGVKAALDGKQDALTFDTTPTANSANPVTSGGVEAAIIPAINQNLDDLYAGDTGHNIYTIIDENLGEGFLYLSLIMGRPPLVRYHQTIVGARGIKIRYSDNKAAYGEWERYYYLTDHDVDATPTANSNNPVSSGGVKDALDGKAPIADTQVQVETLEINPDTGTVDSIYVDNLFQNGNTQVTLIVENATGDTLDIDDAFFTSQQNDLVFMSNAITPNIPADSIVACRILKRETASQIVGGHYYLIIDGIVEY